MMNYLCMKIIEVFMTTRDKKLPHGIEISFGLNENHLIGNNNSIDALKRDFIPCILVLSIDRNNTMGSKSGTLNAQYTLC